MLARFPKRVLQRHHLALAQRIDRRIGDLAEILPEELADQPRLVRDHRERRIVAHRADRFLGGLDHRERISSMSSSVCPAATWRRVSSARS
jgi:hypothetical protein